MTILDWRASLQQFGREMTGFPEGVLDVRAATLLAASSAPLAAASTVMRSLHDGGPFEAMYRVRSEAKELLDGLS